MMIQRYTVIFEDNHVGKCETGNYVLYADHLAALEAAVKEKDEEIGINNPCNHTGFESISCTICGYPDPRKQIAVLAAERSDAWALAFNLWLGDKEPSELDLCGVIHELSERYRAASVKQAEEIERLREALEHIVNPIHFVNKNLKKGERLDGQYAIRLSENHSYLKQIAQDALKGKKEAEP